MHVGQTQYVLQQLRRVARPEAEVDDGELLDAFVLRRDEAAFAALLRRHGPMVWGVCRRLAGQQPDAEDAFQAVFLILVRKAECVRPRERVGAWLHGVAFRTARKARRLAERRRAREKQVEQAPERGVDAMLPDGDLLRIIDEELHRLPERLRLPVLLCDVQGRPQREVARQLAIPVGTLGHRLESARRILARRLTRRGVGLSLAMLAAAVPASLHAVTRRAALAVAAGRELVSLVPPQIVALTEGALTMTRTKSRLAAVLVLAAVLGGFGLHAAQRPEAAAGESEPTKAAPAAKPAEPPADDATFLRRLSMDLRGMLPTDLEMKYFLADKDASKRRKVAGWMLAQTDRWKKSVSAAEQSAEQLSAYWKALVDADQVTREQAQRIQGRLQQFQQLQQQSEPKPSEPKRPSPTAKDFEGLLKQILEQAGKPDDPRNAADIERRKKLLDQLYDLIDRAPAAPDNPEKQEEIQRAIERGLHYLQKQQSKEEVDAFQRYLGLYKPSQELTQKAAPAKGPEGKVKIADRTEGWLTQELVRDKPDQDDGQFFRRLLLDLTGNTPTLVEMNYFLADKDPNKRKKIVEWLMGNPDVQKHLDRTKLVQGKSTMHSGGDRFGKLLDELLASSRGDEQILEALTLATLARFPTDSERQFLGAYLKANGDRKAAWSNVLYVLTNTSEFREHAASMQSRAK